jgi:hypothetical protein
MNKRWLMLTPAGVLGLFVVLLYTFSANAATLRQGSTQAQTGIMFGLANPADTNSSTAIPAALIPAVQEFSDAGAGALNLLAASSKCAAVGLTCNSGDFCQCVETLGTVTDGVGPFFGFPTFDFLLSVNLSHLYNNGNNQGKVCFFGTGVLSFIFSASAQINFDTAGAACNATGTGVALYSGGFIIGPSTGGFSSASGAGMIGFGGDKTTSVATFDLRGAGSNLN